nr:50S ribosomal protein L30 [Pasteuria penetrans]
MVKLADENRGKLRITLRRSMIGRPERQRRVLAALGLRKMGSTVVRPDDASVRGMVAKVGHLVHVDPLSDGG